MKFLNNIFFHVFIDHQLHEIFSRHNPTFFARFSSSPFFHFHRLRRSKVTDNESKKVMNFRRPQKVQKPQKPIIQKRSTLALFDPPYIGQYVPVSAMELKSSFLRGPAHKIEKRPFFAKKSEKWRSGRKGLKLRLALQ